jgi:hypothetical protein
VSKRKRELLVDWLVLGGGALLFISLFLPWSDQFSAPFLAQFGRSALLSGVPHDPTAWQVYSIVDVLLALLAGALVAAALWGGRVARWCTLAGAAVALAFTLQAVATPPTDGAIVFNGGAHYVSTGATAGAGETVAIIALVAAMLGLLVSVTLD